MNETKTGEVVSKEELLRKMNNFWLNLPDDDYPEIPGEPKIRPGWRRQSSLGNSTLDEPMIEHLSFSRESPDEVFDISKFTDIFSGQTKRKFFQQVDIVVEELNMRESLSLLLKSAKSNKLERPRVMNEFAIPIFKKMLELGHNEHKLTV